MYEEILNALLHLPGFIGFDFEYILRSENVSESTIIATHISVGVVAKFYPPHQNIPDLIYHGLGNFIFIICEYIDAEVKFIDWLVEYHEEIDNVFVLFLLHFSHVV